LERKAGEKFPQHSSVPLQKKVKYTLPFVWINLFG